MSRSWTLIGMTCLVITPAVTTAADVARMIAESSGSATGMVGSQGPDQVIALLTAVQANSVTYQVASWLALVAAVLTVPAVVTVRQRTAEHSRRWSLAALICGGFLVVGEFVHLMGYYAWNQILAAAPDRVAAVAVSLQADQNPFAQAVFAPYLVGVLLFWPFAAIALRRSAAIPRWALVLVLAAAVVMTVLGSSFVTTLVWGTAMTVALLPMLVTQVGSARTASRIREMAATEASTSASVVR